MQYAANFKYGWKLIEILLENGAEVNLKDKNGRTPIFDAAYLGFFKNVQILLRAGASTKFAYLQLVHLMFLKLV